MPNFRKFKYNKSRDSIKIMRKPDHINNPDLVATLNGKLQKEANIITSLVPGNIAADDETESISILDFALTERDDDRIGVKFNVAVYYSRSTEPWTFKTPTFYIADTGSQLLPTSLREVFKSFFGEIEDAIDTQLELPLEETDTEDEQNGEVDNGASGIEAFVQEAEAAVSAITK